MTDCTCKLTLIVEVDYLDSISYPKPLVIKERIYNLEDIYVDQEKDKSKQKSKYGHVFSSKVWKFLDVVRNKVVWIFYYGGWVRSFSSCYSRSCSVKTLPRSLKSNIIRESYDNILQQHCIGRFLQDFEVQWEKYQLLTLRIWGIMGKVNIST